jgi:hypothetical protein
MTGTRELGIGNIQTALVDAGGTERQVVLKPSLHAMRQLSRKYSGLQQVMERLLKVDFDVLVDVFELGMQIAPGNPKARAELEQTVYSTGLLDGEGGLISIASNYVAVLMNGGKPPKAGAEEAPPPNPQKDA